ncbi:MAG: ATP cone domain-containing protein [Candidatus Hydrogenedens sp.]
MKSPRKPNKKDFLFDLFGFPILPIQGALRVKKKDGHIEPFSIQKLAESIRKALQSAEVDENGLDYSFATAVKTYLRECHGLEAIISSQEINAITIQVLQEMGQTRTVRHYKEFSRQKHLQQHLIANTKIPSTQPRKKTEVPSNGYIYLFQKDSDMITEKIHYLLEPLQIKKDIQENIIKQVLEILNGIQCQHPSLGFLSELCSMLLKKEKILIPHKHSLLNLHTNDCIEIIKSINTGKITPLNTDIFLGKKVKEQVSRSLIFSSDVIDAHDKGYIYIHILDQPDKLGSLYQSALFLWLCGKNKTSTIHTPHDFWDLLKNTYSQWKDFFINPVTFWGVNWAIAPLLKGLEGNDYKNWLFRWLEECERISEENPGIQVVLDWAVPEKWATAYAFGNCGKNLGTAYSAYQQTAQEMMTDILACICNREKNLSSAHPFIWRFNLPLQIAPSHAFLPLLVSCVEDKEIPVTVGFIPLDSSVDISPQISLGGITINLVRLAYKNPTETGFYSAVFQTILLVIRVYEEILNFLSGYYGDTKGGIWKYLLEQIYKTPGEVPSFTTFPFNLFLSGTREALHILNANKEVNNNEMWTRAENLLKKIRSMVSSCIKDKNLKIQLCLETNTDILRKLAQKDMDDLYDLFVQLKREEPFQFIPQYADEIAPLLFYHPDELIPQFKMLFNIAQLLDIPVRTHFAPQRVWDSLLLGEVIHLFAQTNEKNAPVLLRFIPSE